MPIGHWNLEWANHNSQRRYPLADDATGLDDTGSFELPTDFLVGLDLPIHAGMDVDPARFFIRNIGAYTTGYSIVIGYQPADEDEAPINIASALIPTQGFTRNLSFALGGIGDFDDTRGKVVIGRLDNIAQQPPGFWAFTLETARLDPDAVRPIIRGVSSITCVNGSQQSVPLQGDIVLVAGSNFRITPIITAGQDPIIRFSAISGEGTIEECVCEGDQAPTTPIATINGVAGTLDNNFNLLGSQCISLVPITNGLRITDTCAAPCCGCPELERITLDLDRLNLQAQTVDDFVTRLGSTVDSMSMIVLGTKLGDRGCIRCE